MNIDDSRLIVRFQRLITEMLVEKRLGQRRPGLTDDLYQTWREVGRRGLKEAPEYRDVLLRADRHALWLAGLVRLAAPPVSSPETERTDTLDGPFATLGRRPLPASGGWGQFLTSKCLKIKKKIAIHRKYSALSFSSICGHTADTPTQSIHKLLKTQCNARLSPRTTPPATAARRREARPQQRK